MKYYLINVNNQDLGPLSESEVVELISRGYIPPIARCKEIDQDSWFSVKEFEIFEKELKKLDITWDEDTIIAKLKELDAHKTKSQIKDAIQKKENHKKDIDTEDETYSKKSNELQLDKTIISPQTLKNLEEEKQKINEEKKNKRKKKHL